MKKIMMAIFALAVLTSSSAFAGQRLIKFRKSVKGATQQIALQNARYVADQIKAGNKKAGGWNYHHSCPRSGKVNILGMTMKEQFEYVNDNFVSVWVATLTWTNSKCYQNDDD